MDGDGYDDLWASSPEQSLGTDADVGVVYLLPGAAALGDRNGQTAAELAETAIVGIDAGDVVGRVMVGDFDADTDGNRDVLLNAQQVGAIARQSAALFYGPIAGAVLIGGADRLLSTDDETAEVGANLGFVPSIDSRDTPAIVVNDPRNDEVGNNTGAAWLIPL